MWLKGCRMMVKQVNHLPMTMGKQELQNNVSKLSYNPFIDKKYCFHFCATTTSPRLLVPIFSQTETHTYSGLAQNFTSLFLLGGGAEEGRVNNNHSFRPPPPPHTMRWLYLLYFCYVFALHFWITAEKVGRDVLTHYVREPLFSSDLDKIYRAASFRSKWNSPFFF